MSVSLINGHIDDDVQMTREEQMEALRLSGKTYEEIAKEFGLSRQRVYQIIGGRSNSCSFVTTKERCVYSGLRDYINEQELSIAGFVRLVYGYYEPPLYQVMRSTLKGSNCHKSIIDKILKATGLTYEEAFGRSDTDGE